MTAYLNDRRVWNDLSILETAKLWGKSPLAVFYLQNKELKLSKGTPYVNLSKDK